MPRKNTKEEKQRIENFQRESKRSSRFLLAAVIVTVVILIFGLLLGNYLATSRLQKFQQSEEMFLVDLIALDFRESLGQNVCDIGLDGLWNDKVELGQMLTSLERRLGKDSPQLTTKREIYELIEIKIMQNLEDIKTNCHEDFNIILFFYTNKKNDQLGSAAGSEDQGLILDQINRDHNDLGQGKKVYILVFDINSQNPASLTLKQKYNITKAPSLVINGETHDYMVKDEIEKLL